MLRCWSISNKTRSCSGTATGQYLMNVLGQVTSWTKYFPVHHSKCQVHSIHLSCCLTQLQETEPLHLVSLAYTYGHWSSLKEMTSINADHIPPPSLPPATYSVASATSSLSLWIRDPLKLGPVTHLALSVDPASGQDVSDSRLLLLQ